MSFAHISLSTIFLLGFVHSAFVLRAEGHLDKSSHFGKHVPRGELVELLSKALLYSEVEAHWRGNAMTKNCKTPFTLLDKHICALDPTVSPVTVLQPLPSIEVPAVPANGLTEKRKASSPAMEDSTGPEKKRARTEEMDVDRDSVISSAERTSVLVSFFGYWDAFPCFMSLIHASCSAYRE